MSAPSLAVGVRVLRLAMRRWRVVTMSTGLYAVCVFYHHAERVGVQCVLRFSGQRIATLMGCASPWHADESMLLLHSTVAWVATIVALLLSRLELS